MTGIRRAKERKVEQKRSGATVQVWEKGKFVLAERLNNQLNRISAAQHKNLNIYYLIKTVSSGHMK